MSEMLCQIINCQNKGHTYAGGKLLCTEHLLEYKNIKATRWQQKEQGGDD